MARTRNPNGMGNIYKRDNGTYEWKQVKDGDTRWVTDKNLNELKEKIKKVSDSPIIKGKLKVDDWFIKWLDSVQALKKPGTYEQYSGIYKEHIKPVIGNRKLSSIKQYDIQEIIVKVANKTRTKNVKNPKTGKVEKVDTGKKLSTWTMKHTKKVLNIAFTKAFKDKLIAENPCQDIEIPKRQGKPRKTFTPEELDLLFKQLADSRWIWAVRFLLVTGLRRGELLALKWSNVDFTNRKITIEHSYSSSGLGDTKDADVHYVPLSDAAILYLNSQKEMLIQEFNPILYNQELKKTDIIFPSENGTIMRPDSFSNVIKRAAAKVGVHASPHMFRHTFVHMSKGLMSLSELQEVLGHDESTTTLDIYGAMLSDTVKVASKIDEAFKNLNAEIKSIDKKQKDNIVDFFSHKKLK